MKRPKPQYSECLKKLLLPYIDVSPGPLSSKWIITENISAEYLEYSNIDPSSYGYCEYFQHRFEISGFHRLNLGDSTDPAVTSHSSPYQPPRK
jgi:hypothetical protein